MWEVAFDEPVNAGDHRGRRILAGHREDILAVDLCGDIGFPEDGVQVLLDEIGLAFFDHQNRPLGGAEPLDLRIDQPSSEITEDDIPF